MGGWPRGPSKLGECQAETPGSEAERLEQIVDLSLIGHDVRTAIGTDHRAVELVGAQALRRAHNRRCHGCDCLDRRSGPIDPIGLILRGAGNQQLHKLGFKRLRQRDHLADHLTGQIVKILSQHDVGELGISAGSLQGAFGPAIRLPLFEAGRLRASLRGREADLDLAVESYNQALVEAVREVADRLGALRAIAEQQRQQALVVSAAESVRTLAEARHRAGLGNRLTVLAAQGGVLAQRQHEIDLQARLIDTQIVLIRALGGGYAGEAAR